MTEIPSEIPVRVALRCRPLGSQERCDGCKPCLLFSSAKPQVDILNSEKLQFTFDHTFLEGSKQEEVFTECVLPIIDNVYEGYNVTIMAYGQTGSGKTYTMGTSFSHTISKPEQIGIIPRTIKAIFDGIRQRKSFDFQVKASFLEIYNEQLIDLLKYSKTANKNVGIRDDSTGGKVFGISEHKLNNCDDVLACLERGSLMRTTEKTVMNKRSSRSHAIFTLSIETKNSESEETFVSKLNFVDIGGSARAKKTKAESEHFKEGVNINMGLLALGNVIRALSDGGNRNHVPYRESKLTRLLEDSLGGSSHTIMIACVGPADYNLKATLNTLRYAQRVRKIKNKPVVNQNLQAMEIASLRLLVQQLQEQLASTVINENEVNNPSVSSDQLVSADKRVICLEKENEHLRKELQNAIDQTEKAETAPDKAKQKFEELKQKTGVNDSSEESENPNLKENLNLMKEFQKSTAVNMQETAVGMETQNYPGIVNINNTISSVAGPSRVVNNDTHNDAVNHADNGGQLFGSVIDHDERNVNELEKEVAELQLQKEKLSRALKMAETNSNDGTPKRNLRGKERKLENAENIKPVRAKKKKYDDKGCGCRTACNTKRCKCFKVEMRCDTSCRCTDLCRN